MNRVFEGRHLITPQKQRQIGEPLRIVATQMGDGSWSVAATRGDTTWRFATPNNPHRLSWEHAVIRRIQGHRETWTLPMGSVSTEGQWIS